MQFNKKDMDLVKLVVESLGLDYLDYISKLENDPLTRVILDSRKLFTPDKIYGRLVQWFYSNFKPLCKMHPEEFSKIKNKDKYLLQLLVLFIPSIHLKFYHSAIYDTTPEYVLQVTMKELSVFDVLPGDKKEFELIW